MSKYQSLTDLLPRFYLGDSFGYREYPPPIRMEDLAPDDPTREKMLELGVTEFQRMAYFEYNAFFYKFRRNFYRIIRENNFFEIGDCYDVLYDSPGYQDGNIDPSVMSAKEILAYFAVIDAEERFGDGGFEGQREKGTLIRAVERLRELDDPS